MGYRGGGADDRPNDSGTRAAARLRQAVEASAQGDGRRDDLQAAARDLVHALRGAHQPPEQVLVQIKRILAEGGLHAAFSGDGPSADEGEAAHSALLYRDVIAWSIRYYYDDLAEE